MLQHRRWIAAAVLITASAALTAYINYVKGTVLPLSRNLYFTALITVLATLAFHVILVRRHLPRTTLVSRLIGVAVSGATSFVIYDHLRTLTIRLTYRPRPSPSGDWGHEGLNGGLTWANFLDHLPMVLASAGFYAIAWLPLLVILERWAHGDQPLGDRSARHGTSHTPAA